MIYLDNSATTSVLPEAADMARLYMIERFYNAASAYSPALAVEHDADSARSRLAAMLGAKPEEILFTSGATESNNTAIHSAVTTRRGSRRIIGNIAEHPSVYEAMRQYERVPDAEVVLLGTRPDGSVSLDELGAALTEHTALVSLTHVNNETGAINDIGGAYAAIRQGAPNALFHVDGAQAFCKLPLTGLPCDMYSISGHKFHAPKGIGALFIRNGRRFSPFLTGGGHEKDRRAGTLNVPGIMGMDAALAAYAANQAAWTEQTRACKMRLYENMRSLPDVFVNGPSAEAGAGHILNLSFIGVRGEVLVSALSERGVYVSTGSACSARGKGAKSRVLAALPISAARRESAIRFSFCPFTEINEIDAASEIIIESVMRLRRYYRR